MSIKLSTPPTTDLLIAAFEKHIDEMRALPADAVLSRVNFDVATAVSVVLGALPSLVKLRGQIREACPLTPVRLVDELDTIAHAVLYVQMQSLTAPGTEDRIATLYEQCKALRKRLQGDAVAAAARELVDAEALERIPRGQGRLETAQALLGLSVLFRASWAKAQGRTAVTEEELTKAAQLGVDLLSALGYDDNPSASNESTPIRALRLRAITLFYRTYDELRRAVAYVRWHEGDASDFAPSLVGPRGPRAKVADEGEGGTDAGGGTNDATPDAGGNAPKPVP